MTVTIQIGNSDDKLTQAEWHRFCGLLQSTVQSIQGSKVHFSNASDGHFVWQNYCIVAEMPSLDNLESQLSHLAHMFGQDSIAMTIGETKMIPPSKS